MSTSTDPARPPAGSDGPPSPTPVAERAMAPDLARGMMLLLIVLAHVPYFLYTSDIGASLMHPAGGGVADRIAQAVTIVVVDGRTYTMFAFLFAYGIGQMYTRQLARGATVREARRLLRTRHLWLLGFGLVHAALLWQGDILGTYGLVGLVLVPLLLTRSDRTLKIWIGSLLAVGAVLNLGSVIGAQLAPVTAGANPQQLAIAEQGYLASAGMRVAIWLVGLPSGFASIVLPLAFVIGLLASRHRILEEPARHLPLLRRVTVIGIGIGWSAGIVQVLAQFGMLPVPAPAGMFGLHVYSGLFAGIGYATLFGLIAHRLATRGGTPPLPARALLALGRRSMSGYLAQSVLFAPLLAAWGLGVGAHLSSWSALLVGVAIWLLTVVVAYRLDRAGIRGPAETLLRRLSYGAPRHRVTGGAPDPAGAGPRN